MGTHRAGAGLRTWGYKANPPIFKIMNKLIDPKNPHTVGKSVWNLGNHTLVIMFIVAIVWVIYVSY